MKSGATGAIHEGQGREPGMTVLYVLIALVPSPALARTYRSSRGFIPLHP